MLVISKIDQSSAAAAEKQAIRLISGTLRYVCVFPVLPFSLHWLPVCFQATFMVLMLNGLGPCYLSEHLFLRSTISPTCTSQNPMGGLEVYNQELGLLSGGSLIMEYINGGGASCPHPLMFRKQLKTFLFSQAFENLITYLMACTLIVCTMLLLPSSWDLLMSAV